MRDGHLARHCLFGLGLAFAERLVDGERLILLHEGVDAELHCRVMHRDEEVPMELFTEYRNLGMLRMVGNSNVFM